MAGMNGGPQPFLGVNPSASMDRWIPWIRMCKDTARHPTQDCGSTSRGPPNGSPICLSPSTSCIDSRPLDGAASSRDIPASPSPTRGRALGPPLIPTISPHANWCGWRRAMGDWQRLFQGLSGLLVTTPDGSHELATHGARRPTTPRPAMGQRQAESPDSYHA